MHDTHLLPLYIIGTLLVTGFAVTFVIFVVIQKQRQVKSRLERQRLEFHYSRSLLNTKIEVQETTLQMVAGELHDNINQILGSSFMQLSAAETYMQEDAGKALVKEAKGMVRKAIKDIRLLSHNLNTGMVEHREIEEAIQDELDRISAFSTIVCTLDSEATHEPAPEQRLLIFRIVQEALQNVLKHAKARTIDIVINSSATSFELTLTDDGRGYDVEAARASKASLGMRSILERASMLNGIVKMTSAPGEGSTLALQIPLTPAHE